MGTPATTTDPTWTALITAPYPEWVSGHNCLDAAHVTVLRLFFGDAPGSFQITSTSTFVNPARPAVRTFDTFSQPLAELIEARIWAGLHYRSADVAGQVLGGVAAEHLARHVRAAIVEASPDACLDQLGEWLRERVERAHPRLSGSKELDVLVIWKLPGASPKNSRRTVTCAASRQLCPEVHSG